MWDLLDRLFGRGFMPHGHCYLWMPSMVWTQVASNTLIGFAYMAISATLAVIVWRGKVPFSWLYIAFGTFILACGLTHFIEVATVWHPVYWADAGMRVVTAVASIGTAILVVPLVPRVLALASLSTVARERGVQLEAAVREMTRANALLVREETARKAADEAVGIERARTEQFQERFLAILGHDLRNPLAAIKMSTGLLRKSAGARETKVLDRIASSSTRMARMIDQILDLTRSRLGGGLEVSPAAVDLCEILHQVVDELRVAHPSRVIVLRCEPPSAGTWDRDRLEQVFSNLVGNAISYGLVTSPATVETTETGSEVTVSVHNDGPAIPEALRATLFDPFRRGAQEGDASGSSGLGLGLFISREIVVAHGGSLDAQSDASGTTFRVTLPTVAAPSSVFRADKAVVV
jgi:signal transduction histidine kinase